MATKDVVLEIKKSHFTVKLHPNLLEVDLKKGLKKELEDVLEAKPILRESLGFLFQSAVPLDVPLKDIESATVDKKGRVRITIPHRRDILIPLEAAESRRLVDKLNELIPVEKAKELERIMTSEKARGRLRPARAEGLYGAEEAERVR